MNIKKSASPKKKQQQKLLIGTDIVSLLLYNYWCSIFFFFSSRRRHTRSLRDWSSDVCSSDLLNQGHGLSPLPQGETTTPNYPLNHARSGSDNLTVSTSPARIRPRRSGPSQSYLEVIFIRFRGPQALNDNLENPGLPEMRSRRRAAPGFWPWERHCSLV